MNTPEYEVREQADGTFDVLFVALRGLQTAEDARAVLGDLQAAPKELYESELGPVDVIGLSLAVRP